ncbi:MAG: hypothetical protein AABY05_01325 [Nanoarchaeota archaeon]|mgnify:FL=1
MKRNANRGLSALLSAGSALFGSAGCGNNIGNVYNPNSPTLYIESDVTTSVADHDFLSSNGVRRIIVSDRNGDLSKVHINLRSEIHYPNLPASQIYAEAFIPISSESNLTFTDQPLGAHTAYSDFDVVEGVNYSKLQLQNERADFIFGYEGTEFEGKLDIESYAVAGSLNRITGGSSEIKIGAVDKEGNESNVVTFLDGSYPSYP